MSSKPVSPKPVWEIIWPIEHQSSPIKLKKVKSLSPIAKRPIQTHRKGRFEILRNVNVPQSTQKFTLAQ